MALLTIAGILIMDGEMTIGNLVAFLLKAGMDNKRTKYETNDYKSSKLYFQ